MDFIKKNKKYIIFAGCAIMAIAVFLTFVKVKVSAFGISKSETEKFYELAKDFNKSNDDKCISGYFVLIAAAASAALIYLKKEKYSLISTGTALVITFYDYFKVKDSFSDLGSVAKVSYVAPWVVLIGAVLAAVPIILEIVEERKSNTSTTSASTKEYKFCGECGIKVTKDTKFCPNCGKEIK